MLEKRVLDEHWNGRVSILETNVITESETNVFYIYSFSQFASLSAGSVFVEIQNDYGYVVLVGVASGFLLAWQAIQVCCIVIASLILISL